MKKCASSNRFSWIVFCATLVGVLLAMRLSHSDYSYVGWLLGGAFVGMGVMFGHVPPEKRTVFKWVYLLTAPGITMAIVYNLLG